MKGRYTTVSVPVELAERVKKLIEGTGFKNLTDFNTFVLRELVMERGSKGLEDSKAKVIERLRSLGYL